MTDADSAAYSHLLPRAIGEQSPSAGNMIRRKQPHVPDAVRDMLLPDNPHAVLVVGLKTDLCRQLVCHGNPKADSLQRFPQAYARFRYRLQR